VPDPGGGEEQGQLAVALDQVAAQALNTATSATTAPAYATAATNSFGITDIGWVAKPAFADADGDGDLDLFIGEYFCNTLFFRNTASHGASVPSTPAPPSILTGGLQLTALVRPG